VSAHEPSAEAAHLAEAANVRVTMSMTPREALEFFLKLSSDDAFRARLEADPHTVLAEHHIYIPSTAVPLRASLPPKDALQRILADLIAGREGTVTALPFNVDPMYWFFMDFLIFLLRPATRRSREAG
jgi:hypothetical protein